MGGFAPLGVFSTFSPVLKIFNNSSSEIADSKGTVF
jgi:hypothetical protein